MHFYIELKEREVSDPQEARAMSVIREQSIRWLQTNLEKGIFSMVFRDFDNSTTHIFLESNSSRQLHSQIDPDPLISHAHVSIEPLLTPLEMAEELQSYLNATLLDEKDLEELKFSPPNVSQNGSYFLARKEVLPFSPLLSVATQRRIHENTLLAQKAHIDPREVADFNPIGKAVGILIMSANSEEEVLSHVRSCEVFVDTSVRITKLLTLKQAYEANAERLKALNPGVFATLNANSLSEFQ